jgi:hypothetical protein
MILLLVILGGCLFMPSDVVMIKISNSRGSNTDSFTGIYQQYRTNDRYRAEFSLTRAEQLDILRLADSIDFWNIPSELPTVELQDPNINVGSIRQPSQGTDTIRIRTQSGRDHQVIIDGERGWRMGSWSRSKEVTKELEMRDNLSRLINLVDYYVHNKPEVKELPPPIVRE